MFAAGRRRELLHHDFDDEDEDRQDLFSECSDEALEGHAHSELFMQEDHFKAGSEVGKHREKASPVAPEDSAQQVFPQQKYDTFPEQRHRKQNMYLDPRSAASMSRQSEMELDLDYLERRGEHARSSRGPPPEAEASPDSMDLVKVILLGAPAVGKTSIIQQFVWNDFCEEYVPTDRKHTYYPSVIINDHLYELKISDIPVIPYFPVNSYYEWTDYRFYGLRSATAYVLVFDLSNTDTFQYIRTLREQMLESRDMRNVPLLVVGNKQDLLVAATGGPGSGNGIASGPGTSGLTSGAGAGGMTSAISSGGGGASSAAARETAESREKRRDIVNLVKKHWKCTYIECSAKYNWRVVAVFKELMRAVDSLETSQGGKEVCSPMMDNIHEALDRNKCNIL